MCRPELLEEDGPRIDEAFADVAGCTHLFGRFPAADSRARQSRSRHDLALRRPVPRVAHRGGAALAAIHRAARGIGGLQGRIHFVVTGEPGRAQDRRLLPHVEAAGCDPAGLLGKPSGHGRDGRASVELPAGVWFFEPVREMTIFAEQYDFAITLAAGKPVWLCPARPRTGRRRVRPLHVADVTEPARRPGTAGSVAHALSRSWPPRSGTALKAKAAYSSIVELPLDQYVSDKIA
jgi:hypothetical protein